MAQLTLQQLREFGITPDTNLGQHFLIDDNLLTVIGELCGLDAADVVYEPGAGVGVLTDYLAGRAAHVHAGELDRRLEPALAMLEQRHPNISIIWGDAMAIDPSQLTPPPNKLVSNLPYHVAAPIIAEALQHAPCLRGYCVMVQREVGDRMFALVGGANYGALSVVVQALCTRTGTHKVSRSVFVPQPNVDSQLIAFTRDRSDVPDGDVVAFSSFVRSAFVHRRKTLSNNLLLLGYPRELVTQELARLGLKPAARPQELAPPQFAEIHGRLVASQGQTDGGESVSDGGGAA